MVQEWKKNGLLTRPYGAKGYKLYSYKTTKTKSKIGDIRINEKNRNNNVQSNISQNVSQKRSNMPDQVFASIASRLSWMRDFMIIDRPTRNIPNII